MPYGLGAALGSMLWVQCGNVLFCLGRRLVSLEYLTGEDREKIVQAFLKQCFHFGPRGLDAAVFLTAGRASISRQRDTPEYRNYTKRVENSRELRLALMPFLSQDRPFISAI